MNFDLDPSAVPRFFRGVLADLRQKRLWPAVAALAVALVAVPVLLASSSSPTPQPQAQVPTPPPAGGASIPALSVQTTPTHSRLIGSSHDPFASGASTRTAPSTGSTTASTTTSTAPSTTAPTTAPTTASNGGSVTGGGASSTGAAAPSTGSSATPPANPPSITGSAKAKPGPSGLKPTQAYDVALAMTNSAGGINTIEPLERLSVIPSDQQPLLVELGVAQDGNHVLFAVQPGAVPFGPGTCTPGPIDCEILTLGQDQTEQLSQQTGSIGPAQVGLFAVTGITAANYPSAAAAGKARRATSATGRGLLDKSTSPSLSLFQYEPSLGSVVDLRNLKVGG